MELDLGYFFMIPAICARTIFVVPTSSDAMVRDIDRISPARHSCVK